LDGPVPGRIAENTSRGDRIRTGDPALWINPLILLRFIRHGCRVAEAERAREMDPLARLPRAVAAWMYYLAGRTHEAETEVAALMEMSRNDVTGRRIRAWLLWDQGHRVAAVEELERIRHELQRRPGSSPPTILESELASMRAMVGQTREARAMLASLQERSRRQYVPAEHIAAVEAALGDHDAAFISLERAIEARSNLGQFAILPLSRPLRHDPRYVAMLGRIGLLASPSGQANAPARP
jgi:hypothetical protein